MREAIEAGEGLSDSPTLSLDADRFEQVSQWRCLAGDITPGRFYRFQVRHRAEGVLSEASSVTAVLSWLRAPAGDDIVQRDYVEPVHSDGEWQFSARTLQAPPEARFLRVDLGLRWSDGGSVTWRDMRLEEVAQPHDRVVRVATTRLRPPRPPATQEGNTALMLQIFDEVGAESPDIVLFPENFATQGVPGDVTKLAQPIPGPLTDTITAKARQYHSYAIWTMLEADGALVHNTAVLVDREGRIVGLHRKVHLAMEESEQGITPGSEYPVFDTDFGRIGIVTCWDNWFGETARILRLKGAEVLFFPLAGDSQPLHWDHVWRTRAIDNGVFLVSSVMLTKAPSRIIDFDGEVLAETDSPFGFAIAELPLDRETRKRYMSVGDALGEPASLFVKERRPETYSELSASPVRAEPRR